MLWIVLKLRCLKSCCVAGGAEGAAWTTWRSQKALATSTWSHVQCIFTDPVLDYYCVTRRLLCLTGDHDLGWHIWSILHTLYAYWMLRYNPLSSMLINHFMKWSWYSLYSNCSHLHHWLTISNRKFYGWSCKLRPKGQQDRSSAA